MLLKRDFKYIIKIDNVKLINLNTYLLLKAYLNKQVKQVIKLLDRKLISEFLSF